MAITPVITLTTLGVTDLDRSTAFYQALGWPLSSESVPGEISFFRTAGALLALWDVDKIAADAGQEPAKLQPGSRGLTHAINLADRAAVDAAFVEIEAAGGAVLKAPGEMAWGGYSGYFADPDGHVWEVAHNPFWPLGENGMAVLSA